MQKRHRPYDLVKRCLDLVVASLALVLLSPVMLATGIAVAYHHGKPVFFRQERPGVNGKVFTLYKFRSMHDIDPSKGLVTPAERITKFGSALRASSLDELPSLVNVIRGDMSIVGPRPLLVKYLELYTPQQARRHDVRPGITGLSQVSGRNGLNWTKRLVLDVVYVRKRSFLLDLCIIARTIRTVAAQEGISEAGQVSVREFTGNRENGLRG